MRVLDDPIVLGVLTLGVCLIGFPCFIQAGGQNTVTHSHVVAVRSDPPGAVIWKKEGRDYTCTNTLTPGTIELTFHGDNDVKRIQLRRFGDTVTNLDVKSTDKEIRAVLGKSDSKSFLVADDASPDLKKLNAALKKQYEKIILADQEAFRCTPFNLDFIHLRKSEGKEAFDLVVAIKLDRSFGGPAFRLANRAGNAKKRSQKMGQIALEGGIAEIIARFHRVAAKFPDLKMITVHCSYSTSTTQAVLDTERNYISHTTVTPIYRGGGGKYYDQTTMEYEYKTVSGWIENTVVNDQFAEKTEKTITFVMPTAEIPDTLDKKAISDAVLAVGKIFTDEDNMPIMDSADDYYNRGRDFGEKGDHAKSIAHYTKAIEINPKYAKAYYFRGAAWGATLNNDKAIADFTKAIEIDPRYAEAYWLRGQCWNAKGDHAKCIADMTKANEIDPNIKVFCIK